MARRRTTTRHRDSRARMNNACAAVAGCFGCRRRRNRRDRRRKFRNGEYDKQCICRPSLRRFLGGLVFFFFFFCKNRPNFVHDTIYSYRSPESSYARDIDLTGSTVSFRRSSDNRHSNSSGAKRVHSFCLTV